MCTIYSRHQANKIVMLLWPSCYPRKNTWRAQGHSWTLKNPTVLEQLVRNEQAYKFLKNVRGLPAYWQDQLYVVLAMLLTLGNPTWFLT